MSAPRTLVLLRHGQTAWNAEGRAQGHLDVGLDDVGRAQAAAVAPAIAALRPDVLWSSDLARAATTAAVVAEATGLTVRHDARLREYDVGERAGLTIPEFAAAYPAEHARWAAAGGSFEHADAVPGAESTDDVLDRVLPALTEALASAPPGGTACVVSHGAALKAATIALLGWDRTASVSLRGMDNCAHTVLDDAGPAASLRLVAWNRTPDFAPRTSVG
ncbi:histidine phosphatase family protein [Nocardioides sp. P5_C9_2]